MSLPATTTTMRNFVLMNDNLQQSIIFICACERTSLNTIQGIQGRALLSPRGIRKEPGRTEDGPVGVLKAEKAKAAMVVVVVPAEVAAAVLVAEKMGGGWRVWS
jgi:hypothetical protein